MSVDRTVHLTLDDALWIHGEQVRLFGGAPDVRDRALLESALGRLLSGYLADLIEKAAALWEGLTRNHPFVDGNKRVGLACADVFLGLNGWRLDASPEAVSRFILSGLEEGAFSKETLEAWLRGHAKPHRVWAVRPGAASQS